MYSILLGLAFVCGSITLTFASYLFMRMVFGADAHKDKELAASVLTRIAALHALILALVFAQEMVDYQQLRNESAVEANAVADIYNDGNRFGGEQGSLISANATTYLTGVIEEDWPLLGTERRLAATTWDAWSQLYEAVLTAKPADARQESLRDHMLESVHTISEQRVKREMVGQDNTSSMFWFAAISGLIFSAAAYYPYDLERRSLLLLSMFGAFTGIILYLIYAFSDPYRPPGSLGPGAFERLRQAIAIQTGKT